jgi:hypothetical protein
MTSDSRTLDLAKEVAKKQETGGQGENLPLPLLSNPG